MSLDFAVYLFNFMMSVPGKLLTGETPSNQAGAGVLSGLLPVLTGAAGGVIGGPGGGILGGIIGNVIPGILPQQQAGLLNPTQIFAILPEIVQTLVAALQFVFTQAHTHYHDTPQPYWRGLTAVDCAAQIIQENVHESETVVVYTVPGTWASWNDGPPAWTAWELP